MQLCYRERSQECDNQARVIHSLMIPVLLLKHLSSMPFVACRVCTSHHHALHELSGPFTLNVELGRLDWIVIDSVVVIVFHEQGWRQREHTDSTFYKFG